MKASSQFVTHSPHATHADTASPRTKLEQNSLQRAAADVNFHHNAHIGIIYTDAQNCITYTNPYFLQMINIADPADILGKPFPHYMWEPSTEQKLFADVRANGYVRERELTLYNNKGEPVFVSCSSVASRDDAHNFTGTEIMLCNVTAKRKIQAQLTERTLILERLTEFSRQSLSMLMEMTQRGATRREMLTILKQLQDQLEQSTR